MSKQLFFTRRPLGATNADNTNSEVTSFTQIQQWGPITSAVTPVPWCVDGQFANLKVKVGSAPGAGNSVRIRPLVNGAAPGTNLSVTISDTNTEGDDLVNTTSVSDGNTLVMQHTPTSTPTVSRIQTYVEFTPTTPGQLGFGYCNGSFDGATTATKYNGLFQGRTVFSTVIQAEIVPIPGTLTKYAVRFNTALGAGASRTWNIVKNGVVQDGTGGTVDTTITVSGATDIAGSWTGSLTLAAGDQVYVQMACSSGLSRRVSLGCRFEPDDDDAFFWCGYEQSTNLSDTTVEYAHPTNTDGALADELDATESQVYTNITPVTQFTVNRLFFLLEVAPGSGKSYTATISVDGSVPGGAPSVTISDSNTTGSDTSNSATIGTSSVWSVKFTPAGTPTTAQPSWGIAATVAGVGGGGRSGHGFVGPMAAYGFAA